VTLAWPQSLPGPVDTVIDDRFARELRGFGPLGILSILVILLIGSIPVAPMVPIPVGALLALAWAWRSRTPWRAIGYAPPGSWALTIVNGVLIGVALKLLLKSVVLPLLGADPVNHTYHFLAGNRALLPAAIWTMLNAAFLEETVFRGFLFERLGRLLRPRSGARLAILLVTSALFALGHRDQGMTGMEQAAITGLCFGALYLASGAIWLPMIAHAAFDLTALWIIYAGLEERVAHLFFR
jgi:membrane protease YdiL (CAAX protease family)